MQYLQQKSGAQTQQEFEAYIQQLGEEGLQQEYAQFMQMVQQQQVAARKFGGMLNYVRKLRGICPEGYEMQFFKQGGQICKKCVQRAKMEDGGKTPENPIDAFRCGRKMKKKACGGTVKEAKCGTKVEMDKCGKKMKKKACGGPVKEKFAIGGKTRRPFTGFEGLSYKYEAPTKDNDYTEYETITNNDKFLIDHSRSIGTPSTANRFIGEIDPDESYTVYNEPERAYIDANPDQMRAFNSLKRHAIMNQQLENRKFACGGKAKKKQ